ncbi:aldose epimerase family protein [Zobellia galactanivorans]|uniref:Aldose 1-epimerase n=1 Tax=Zobellia galactanivorans (strain DSM 12802 / CCUG 47099 / CIP 106680 / NCIMB 13871 / Dsij) TaxID=63186 RepID=G0L4M7_ZOBGA|nr:aldose epimerase family protein [Zobellia galactanivorans]CAZ98792.1 Aldose 1-epimerase [Zobellia galactanivorans]
MKTTQTDFGVLSGENIYRYTLENDNGLSVKISNYGATITSILLPQKTGKTDEIVCGFDTFESYFSEAYQANAPYFGGTVGRYCSQIKDARFSLNGKEYQLARIVGDNNLHGGKIGFDKKIWKVKAFSPEVASVQMELESKHLEEGFPGNVTVQVTFTLTNDNELKIRYGAITDQDTPFTITNHTYFNLSGFAENVEGHTVMVDADTKQLWDETGAATGENVSVAGKVDDLRSPKTIKEVHEAMGDGFEHFYLFEDKGFELGKVAEISEPKSGRTMEVFTTEPGMLLYTGKYTSDELKRESGLQYGKYRGFCCETHRYPNGPNISDAPKTILKVGEDYDSTTIFKFNW